MNVTFFRRGLEPFIYVDNKSSEDIGFCDNHGIHQGPPFQLDPGSGPRRVGLTSNKVFSGVTIYDAGTVSYFNTGTNSVFKTVDLSDPTHPNPHPIGIRNFGLDVYVAEPEYDELVVIFKDFVIKRDKLSSINPYDGAVVVVKP